MALQQSQLAKSNSAIAIRLRPSAINKQLPPVTSAIATQCHANEHLTPPGGTGHYVQMHDILMLSVTPITWT